MFYLNHLVIVMVNLNPILNLTSRSGSSGLEVTPSPPAPVPRAEHPAVIGGLGEDQELINYAKMTQTKKELYQSVDIRSSPFNTKAQYGFQSNANEMWRSKWLRSINKNKHGWFEKMVWSGWLDLKHGSIKHGLRSINKCLRSNNAARNLGPSSPSQKPYQQSRGLLACSM